MRIYIAGPITPRGMRPDTDNYAIEYLLNIRDMVATKRSLMKKGWSPYCPGEDMLTFLVGGDGVAISESEIKLTSMEWLDASEAIIMVRGWTSSPGALAEFNFARGKKIPIYLSLDEVPDLNKEGKE
jgi:hypothetical protein